MKQVLRIPKDTKHRARHGETWTKDEVAKLLDLWDNTTLDLLEICDLMERPVAGVVPKLVMNNRIWDDIHTRGHYWHNPRGQQTNQTTDQEQDMSNTPVIETKTFIAGVDAATMSDAQIFRKIASIEQDIDKLLQIKRKPQKLIDAIETMRKDVVALCEYVDSREAA
jgi:hypothetical protein